MCVGGWRNGVPVPVWGWQTSPESWKTTPTRASSTAASERCKLSQPAEDGIADGRSRTFVREQTQLSQSASPQAGPCKQTNPSEDNRYVQNKFGKNVLFNRQTLLQLICFKKICQKLIWWWSQWNGCSIQKQKQTIATVKLHIYPYSIFERCAVTV